MTQLPFPARVFVGFVILAGFSVIGYSIFVLAGEGGGRMFVLGPINSSRSLIGLGLFLLLAPLATMAVILIPEEGGERIRQSLSASALMASVVVFPIYLTVVIMAVAMASDQLRKAAYGSRLPYRALFNTAEVALAAAAAAGVFSALGGRRLLLSPHLPGAAPHLLLADAAAIVAGYATSYGLTFSAVSLSSRVPLPRLFWKPHRNTILPEATAAVVGVLFGYLWIVNPPLSPLALLPLAVIYVAFKNFVRLQEVDRLKSNFISEVSHELRTPLSAMLASSELLYYQGDRLSPENVRELSRSSYESSNHLFRLVENLLNATTLQSGTLQIRPVSVSLDELIGDAVTQVQPFIESKQQRMCLNVPTDLPEVLADPRHIVQVLINLLTNASKYSDERTTIAIGCTAQGDLVRISVTDQGIGIAEEEQRHIFERFYRVPANRETSVVGSGLGLTIVKSVVELHRGKVGVSSLPGAGSEFWFTLPKVSMAGTS